MIRKAEKADYQLSQWAAYDCRKPNVKAVGELPGENVVNYAAVLVR